MSNEQVVLQQYLEFCASPLRTEQSIKDEYQQLLRNPDVTHVAFHKPHILMVGTKMIVIHDDDKDYEIGEFIIFLTRKRIERVWETSFNFTNYTHPINRPNKKGEPEDVAMHPHIVWWSSEIESEIEAKAGDLCIANGQMPIYQALRKGYINTAVAHLIVVLQTYCERPYLSVDHWPQVTKELDND